GPPPSTRAREGGGASSRAITVPGRHDRGAGATPAGARGRQGRGYPLHHRRPGEVGHLRSGRDHRPAPELHFRQLPTLRPCAEPDRAPAYERLVAGSRSGTSDSPGAATDPESPRRRALRGMLLRESPELVDTGGSLLHPDEGGEVWSKAGPSFPTKTSPTQPRRWPRMQCISASAIRLVTTITAWQRTRELVGHSDGAPAGVSGWKA